MKKITLLIICCLSLKGSAGQQKVIDSLNALLASSKPDTNRINLLILLDNKTIDNNPKLANSYMFEALKLSEILHWQHGRMLSCSRLGSGYYILGNYPVAMEYYQKSLHIADSIGERKGIASAYNNLANVYQSTSDISGALNYYLKALKITEETNDEKGTEIELDNIGSVYQNQKNYPAALDYYTRALKKSESQGNEFIQSDIYNDMGSIYGATGNYGLALKNDDMALKISRATNNKILEGKALNNEAIIFIKQNDYKKAEKSGGDALEIAKKTGALDLQRNANKSLSEIFEKENKPAKALAAFRQYIILRDSILNVDKQKEITSKGMQLAFDKKQAETKAAQDKKDFLVLQSIKEHDLEIKGFIGGGILLLLLVGVLYNRYRYERKSKALINKEKLRSDELLLNILPAETAEELKKYGKASAKSYDEVTVFFSDVKGFTMIAAQLSAEDLVKEIDSYFQAFDNIVEKHGLEKIKTIGDAYLCVGGLPVPDSRAAEKVIMAALEMQEYVKRVKEEKIIKDQPYFEVRFGINSGPCVAGVVGIKKFAYDIWGDTVNMAARMEQHSEPGKINISESTYQLVKDKFKFTYRGLVEAKNKGGTKMYYVDGIV